MAAGTVSSRLYRARTRLRRAPVGRGAVRGDPPYDVPPDGRRLRPDGDPGHAAPRTTTPTSGTTSAGQLDDAEDPGPGRPSGRPAPRGPQRPAARWSSCRPPGARPRRRSPRGRRHAGRPVDAPVPESATAAAAPDPAHAAPPPVPPTVRAYIGQPVGAPGPLGGGPSPGAPSRARRRPPARSAEGVGAPRPVAGVPRSLRRATNAVLTGRSWPGGRHRGHGRRALARAAAAPTTARRPPPAGGRGRRTDGRRDRLSTAEIPGTTAILAPRASLH